jgi:hypothetical protein
MKRYYFLAFANFLSAIGGGAILSSAAPTLPDFTKGAIVAFLIGAVIGLFFQVLVPERWSRHMGPWFSVGVGPTSLLLAWLIKAYADNETLRGAAAYSFVALLSVRFGLWFFSRALRAQTAGSRRQGIALIELGYYSGMVFGLIVQGRLEYGMLTALLIDAILQPVAGLIDLANADGRKAPESTMVDLSGAQDAPRAHADAVGEAAAQPTFDYGWYWRLTAAVVCLTIGFQAVTLSIDHDNDGPSPYVLACFYGGVALAALFCRVFQIRFDWGAVDGRLAGNARISSDKTGLRLRANVGLITLAAAASMVAALSGSILGHNPARFELPLIAAAAFIYQILVLSLLDRIGRAEKLARFKEGIKLTYLLLGIGTVLSVLLLGLSPNKQAAGVIVTVACSLISFYAVRRRAVAHA